jgi:hypothetical protein
VTPNVGRQLPLQRQHIVKQMRRDSNHVFTKLNTSVSKTDMPLSRIHENTVDNDNGHEVELNRIKIKTMQLRDGSQRTSSKAPPPPRESSRHGGRPIDLDHLEDYSYSGPIDLDELFVDDTMATDTDGESLFDEDHEDTAAILEESFKESEGRRYFNNPRKRRIDTDTSMIPGSPFSKPPNKPSTRPKEPIALAKYASTLAFSLTFSLIGLLFFFAISNYTSVSRIM